MAVRPFYISANIEGRQTYLEGGPRRKDGAMSIAVTQRDEGVIKTAVKIECHSFEENGKLVLCTSVYDNKGNLINAYQTNY